MITKSVFSAALIGAALACFSPAAFAAPAQPVAAPAPAVEPEAIAALKKVGAYLRTLTNFEIKSQTLDDQVLDSGQKVQFAGTVAMKVRRPNGFYIEAATDRQIRRFYYNGKTFTLFAPRMGYYAQADAPKTIAESIDQIKARYGIEMPLADLFFWGTDDADINAITLATKIGYAKIDGVDCDQYAYRNADLDWQVFIERGARPLPRKLVVTTRTDPASPQFSSVIDWNLSPTFDASTFEFTPPPNGKKIAFQTTPVS